MCKAPTPIGQVVRALNAVDGLPLPSRTRRSQVQKSGFTVPGLLPSHHGPVSLISRSQTLRKHLQDSRPGPLGSE